MYGHLIISFNQPNIRQFLVPVSDIRPDIRQVKSGIQPDTGYKKGRIIRKAKYPVHPNKK
jgi:hypothetical protein